MEGIGNLRNKPIERLAPNGEKSNLTEDLWHYVRTREFKEVFGDWEDDPTNSSKAIDKNGEPMAFYFGGPPNIHRLNRDNPKNTGKNQQGYYLTPRMSYAKFYANKTASEEVEVGRIGMSSIYTCFLNVRNILTVNKGSNFSPSSINEWPEDYDCINDNRTGNVAEVVVRDARQVIIAKEVKLKDKTPLNSVARSTES